MKAELKIKNFRTLKNVKVDMRPTMFLLGPNGSGKSTFIKSLIFLSQFLKQKSKNIQYDDKGVGYDLKDSKINLRSFENIVSNGDSTKEIEFDFEYSGEFDLKDYMKINGERRTG